LQELPNEISDVLKKLDVVQNIEKVDLLNFLAQYYLDKDPKLTIQHAENSRLLSQELSDGSRLARSLFLLGKGYYTSIDFFTAIEHFTTCSILFESLGDSKGEIDSLTTIGICRSTMGDYSRALDNHFKALKIAQKIGDTKAESESLMQIGLAFLGNKESDLALEYLNKAYEMRLAGNDKHALGSITGNLGNIYIQLEDFQKAIDYYEKCRAIFEELGNPVGVGRAHLNISMGLGGLGKFDEALISVNKSLETFTKLDNKKEQICSALSTIGAIYSEKGEHETAMEYYNKAVDIANQFNFVTSLENLYGSISDSAAALGDYKNAYEHYVKYHNLVKQRMSEASEVKTRYLNVSHKVDTLKKESDELSAKNSELKELNERLTQLNNEKNEFLGIAAHDLKNPLASISLSAATIKKYLEVFPKEKIESHLDKIEQTSTRMKNIVTNLININAIETGEYNVVKNEIDLSALVNYIVDDFQHRASQKGIEIVFTQDDKIKINTDENAIYSILDNLISNALKYSSEGAFVFIKLNKTDKVTVKIKDNGLGIQDSEKEKVFSKFARISNKPTAGENSTGLGLSIVKRLTELIGGKVYFESEFGKGTTFTLELPFTNSEIGK
jgi:signal transduction histidine kinase/Flp pilus assembly protein TadD